MQPDLATLLVVSICIDITMGIYFLATWVARREREIYFWMGASATCGAIGCLLFMLRGVAPDWLTLWLASVFFLQTFAFFWAAVRHVDRKSRPLRVIWLGTVIWTIVCLIPPIYGSETVRNSFSSVLIASYSLAMSIEILRGRRDGPIVSRLMASGALFLYVCLCVWLVGLSAFQTEAVVPLSSKTMWPAILLLENIADYIVMVLTLTTLELDNEAMRQRLAATTDVLTGILNRRAFLEQAICQIAIGRGETALLVFDIDHFKAINDTHGHAAGDRALVVFAEEVGRQCLDDDAGFNANPQRPAAPRDMRHWLPSIKSKPQRALIGRLGGEEFACLLSDTTGEQAEQFAEGIRQSVSRMKIDVGGACIGMTVSVGVATANGICDDVDGLLKAADKALYQAKGKGRNRVERASNEPSSSPDALAGGRLRLAAG